MVSTATMARLARMDEKFMQSTCLVLRRVRSGTAPVITRGAETQIARVDCRLRAISSAMFAAQEPSRVREETITSISVPLGTDVQTEDVISVETDWGTTRFEVLGDPVAGTYSTSLEVPVAHEER